MEKGPWTIAKERLLFDFMVQCCKDLKHRLPEPLWRAFGVARKRYRRRNAKGIQRISKGVLASTRIDVWRFIEAECPAGESPEEGAARAILCLLKTDLGGRAMADTASWFLDFINQFEDRREMQADLLMRLMDERRPDLG